MSEKNQSCSTKRTSIGGQALIEGIMMRGPKKEAISVRNPQGEIITTVKDLKSVRDKYPILRIPVVRGAVALVESLVSGIAALNYSAEFYPEEEDPNYKPGKFEQWLDKKMQDPKAQKASTAILMVISFVIAIVVFFFLPTLITGWISRAVESNIVKNLIEGVIRIVIFLVYLFAVSRMKDIKRVFSYHGAEHKTIFCYEAGKELTVENVRPMSCHHPRCGTSFLFVVFILAIIVFSLVPWMPVLPRLVVRIVLIPVIVGIAFEFNRAVGRHDNWLTRILTAPGMALQNLTTFEPDDSMIEVAIAAMKEVIPQEEGLDNW
ncbi:MAG: DUF1385 domain-containing protein [Oscillospiraceae bacterium]|nr:DUF1385 domain-containing protein [Oscillospiraceae bacterium]